MEIIKYENKYYNNLVSFFAQEYPEINSADTYVDYCINLYPKDKKECANNLLVIDNGKIVGMQLYFETQASINSNVKTVLWGHHTIVTDEYRKTDAGLMLILSTCKISAFGCGLTEINKKILKIQKKRFIGKSQLFIQTNRYLYKLVLHKFFKTKLDCKNTVLPCNIGSFNLIKHINAFKVFNNGFWNQHNINTDFIRDHDFIDKRFFKHFNTYYLYQSDIKNSYSYFVIRFCKYKDIPVLALIDYRFPIEQLDIFDSILRHVTWLALKNKISVSLTRASLPIITERLLKNKFSHKGVGADIVSGDTNSLSTWITLADSDGENGLY